MSSPRFSVTLKALIQLGPGPLTLYALYRLGLATGHYQRAVHGALRKAEAFTKVQPLFALPTQNDLTKLLGSDGRTALLKEADEIVAGRVRLFGGASVPLHLDFEGPLRPWTDYATGKAALPLSRAAKSRSPGAQATDIKFIWEPARFGWAFTLGRAYWLAPPAVRGGQRRSKAETYAETFWKYFETFERGNPPCCGPNWMNGQEVAIRLLALVWCAQVFDSAVSTTHSRRVALARSVAQHAARIPATLVYARSQNNNHLVTESAALYTAGLALGEPSWKDLGWRWLNRALQNQIGSSGEYIQHSTNYHRLVLQAALWVDAILRNRRASWPAPTLGALARASHWLFSTLDPVSGRVPNLGPNDGALILPLDTSAFHDYRPTVQAAARAFLRTALPPGPWDELSLWLGLRPAKHTAGSEAYVADHPRGRASWAYLRATQFRSRLSHMDQLHLDVWWKGLNLAQDAGTYLYDAPRPWDNPLVLTRVHNTVTVDGLEQMARAGRFLTLDWFPAHGKAVIPAERQALAAAYAYHNGYGRLRVRHERLVTVFRGDRWEIKDSLILTRPGEHLFRLHWLLPDWNYQLIDSPLGLRLASPYGAVIFRIETDPSPSMPGMRLTLARAGQVLHGTGSILPIDGWTSPTYGLKQPALSLAVEVRSSQSFSFLTRIDLPRSGGRPPK